MKNHIVIEQITYNPSSRLFVNLDKLETLIPANNQGKISNLARKKSLQLIAYYLLPIYEKQTKFQHILLAKYKNNRYALFQDSEWQFLSGKDAEREFHKYEAKIPAFIINKNEPKVLIIGGGDGLAARDVLEVKPNAKITLVDIDPEMVRFAKTHPIMRRLNKDSLQKVKYVAADGITFLLSPNNQEKYDLIIIDLPDPIRETTEFLYETPLLYGILNALKTGGVVSIYSTAHYSPIQEEIAEELKPFFYKTKKVGARVAEMGIAGFVWGIGKKKIHPEKLAKMRKMGILRHKKYLQELKKWQKF